MKDIEVLKALIESTAHRMGTTFSDACLALLTKIVTAPEPKELEKK